MTSQEKYGDKNFNNRNKCKETCIEKYGVEHHQQNKEISRKTVQTQCDRYGGVFHPSKVKATNKFKYGCEYHYKIPMWL